MLSRIKLSMRKVPQIIRIAISAITVVLTGLAHAGTVTSSGEALAQANSALSRARASANRYESVQKQFAGAQDRLRSAQQRITDLAAQKQKALEDLRNGAYCTACNKTRTEVEATGENFVEHCRKNSEGGVPHSATPEMIALATRSWDDKIAQAEASVSPLQAQVDKLSSEQRSAENGFYKDYYLCSSYLDAERILRQREETLRTSTTLQSRDGAITEAQNTLKTARANLDAATARYDARWGATDISKMTTDELLARHNDAQSLRPLEAAKRQAQSQLDTLESAAVEIQREGETRAANVGPEHDRIRSELTALHTAVGGGGGQSLWTPTPQELGVPSSAYDLIGSAHAATPRPSSESDSPDHSSSPDENSTSPSIENSDSEQNSFLVDASRETLRRLGSEILNQAARLDDVDVKQAARDAAQGVIEEVAEPIRQQAYRDAQSILKYGKAFAELTDDQQRDLEFENDAKRLITTDRTEASEFFDKNIDKPLQTLNE